MANTVYKSDIKFRRDGGGDGLTLPLGKRAVSIIRTMPDQEATIEITRTPKGKCRAVIVWTPDEDKYIEVKSNTAQNILRNNR